MNYYEKIRNHRNHVLHGGTPPLVWGCEIIQEDAIDWAKHQTIVHYDLQKSVLVAKEPDGSTYRKKTLLKGYKILGKPVTLDEVLVMLNKADEDRDISERQFVLSAVRNIHECEDVPVANSFFDYPIVASLDLTKPLENQPPDTLEAICKLLGV